MKAGGGSVKKGESRTGAGKFSKVELGNRCEWGGAALQGRVEALGCVSACLRANARARYLCVRARAGVGQGMSAHWASGSFSRRDHFTLPPLRSPLFHLKRLVSADWALAGSAIGSGRVELFQPTSRPQNYCRTKEKRERRGERKRGTLEKKFLFFSFFSPIIASPCSYRVTWTRGPRVLHCGWGEQVGLHRLHFYF